MKQSPTTAKSEKAAAPLLVNAPLVPSQRKRTNFDLVTAGLCPHDNSQLGDAIRGNGVGVTRVCETCGHTWYIHKKIRTCKC